MPELDHTPDDAVRIERLTRDDVAWLATIRPDGRPHLVPVWFLWTGEAIFLTTEPRSQKVKNLQANPRLSLALDDSKGGTSPVIIEGTAELASLSRFPEEISAYFKKYRETMTGMHWTEEESRLTHSTVVKVSIERFLTF